MNILIVVLIILTLVGSILWVVPTRREKELTAMRSEALKLGFRVHFLNQALFEQYFKRMPDTRGYVVYERVLEGLDLQEPCFVGKEYLSEASEDDLLFADTVRERLTEARNTLNDIRQSQNLDVAGVLLKKNHISIVWFERGGAEGVQALSDYVSAWKR